LPPSKPSTVQTPTPPPAQPPVLTPRPLPPHTPGRTDPFEKLKPTKPHGKVKGRASGPDRDPFESAGGKATKEGRKASPFD